MPSLPKLPPRKPDAHKGDFGRALIFGGSRGMAGAIALAGMACLRSGAGLVRLAVPKCIVSTVSGFEPSYMTVPLPDDDEGQIRVHTGDLNGLTSLSSRCHVRGSRTGPGAIGRSGRVCLCCVSNLSRADGPRCRRAQRPGPHRERLGGQAERPARAHAASGRIRPAGGLGQLRRAPRSEQVAKARLFARSEGIVVLLKGHQTFITDGTREVVNTTGNPGMATGGMWRRADRHHRRAHVPAAGIL